MITTYLTGFDEFVCTNKVEVRYFCYIKQQLVYHMYAKIMYLTFEFWTNLGKLMLAKKKQDRTKRL